MNNREYWSKRSEQLEEALLNKGENFANDLDNQYKIANARLQKEIDAWYQRFAKNNCISLTEAKRLLNTNELKEFRWTVQDYIKYGQKNAVNPYWMEELENASCKVHISRLEALKLQLQQQVEVLYGNQLDGLDKTMKDIYSEGYYRTAFEIQKGFNTGYSFMKFNGNELEKVISKPWAVDGENFSSRVWKNKSKLINTLHTNLTQALIRGDNPEKIVGNIATTMETTRKAARRLVMTESAYFSSASQKDCYNDLNIERYEIVATLDSHTSETCQELDGKVFKMSDYEVGVTAPPFHCWCRTCTAPYFNDEFTLGEKRTARSLNDKTEYIPSNIKYPEWKKKYVKAEKLNESTKGSITKITDKSINSVNKLDINGLTKEENEIIYNEHKNLLEYAMNNNDSKEVSYVFSKGLINKSIELGEKDGLEFRSSNSINILSSSHSIFVMHNHPTNKSFSMADLQFFITNENVKYLSIVKNNGGLEVLIKNDKYDTVNVKNQLFRLIKKNVKSGTDAEYDKVVKKFLEKSEDITFMKG